MPENVALIPVRMGSERLPKKNYKFLGDKMVVEVAIINAKRTGGFDEIYLSTDDPALRSIAERHDIKFLHRRAELASSIATSEQVVADFIETVKCRFVTWVNTVSPLQTVEDIRSSVEKFKTSGRSSFVAVNKVRTHCSFKGAPLNFGFEHPFARTQDLVPVTKYVYSTMGWDSEKMLAAWSQGYRGLFLNDCLEVEVSENAGLLLKTDEDFRRIEGLYNLGERQ